jgi:hypothetical protein
MKLLRSTVAVLLLAVVAGPTCADRMDLLAPPAVAGPQENLIGGLLGTVTNVTSQLLTAVVRVAPLSQPVTVRQTVGPAGGVVRGRGVVLTIPPGALSRDTDITMVVPSGPHVQAQFYPHGLVFEKPVKLEFDLSGTSAANDSGIVGAYFTLPILNGLIQPSELFNATVRNGSAEFWIRHFSTYAPALGRSGYTAAGG